MGSQQALEAPVETTTPNPKERRYSQRWFSGKQIQWRIHRGRRIRSGVVTERSLNGMILAVEALDAVAPGVFVFPADDRSAQRHGFHTAVICRTAQAGPDEKLLFVEILA